MEEAKETKCHEILYHLIKGSNLTEENKDKLISAIHVIADKERTLRSEEDKDEWFKHHAHRSKYMGAIGGHISKHTTHTSIGDLDTYFCGVCYESAFVFDGMF